MGVLYANNDFSFIILRDIHYRFTLGRVLFIYSLISYANFGLMYPSNKSPGAVRHMLLMLNKGTCRLPRTREVVPTVAAYGTVRYRYRTVTYGTVPYGTVPYVTEPYGRNAIPYGTVR